MTLGRERRGSIRVTCTELLEGVALKPGSLFRGMIRDISETGCYVVTKAQMQIEPDRNLELRFRLNGEAQRVLARVVEMKPLVGIRTEFVETGPRFLKAVRWYQAEWLREGLASTGESLTEHEGKPLAPAAQ
jgi:hypothetical protein